jgi:signal transduction histidine kinase
MRERALLVGGRLTIDSRPAQGTEVRLTIPVEEHAGA